MTALGLVEQRTILRATVGSTVHGLHHGGQDDRDEMAVFIEPPEYLVGLRLAQKDGVRNPFRFADGAPRGARPGGGRPLPRRRLPAGMGLVKAAAPG